MPLPVILIHGYSSEGKTVDDGDFTAQTVGDIYGRMVQDLIAMGVSVVPVNVSRYVSLDDGVGVDDISLALHRALKDVPALKDGFDAIVHSTGALVARNWVRRHCKPDGSCPMRHLIYLAGANLGSGWAHVGATQFVRFARAVQGVQPGTAVLEDLELASSWTIDLHAHFLDPEFDMFHGYGVMEFNLVGSQVPPEYLPIPVSYGKENGSDGVMRVCASNLNFNYVEIAPTTDAGEVDWDEAVAFAEHETHSALDVPKGVELDSGYYEIVRFSKTSPPSPDGSAAARRPQVPFAIPYNTDHSDMERRSGIVSGSDNRDQVLPLVRAALSATPDNYASLVEVFDAETRATYDRVRTPEHDASILARVEDAFKKALYSPKVHYDPHAQVVVRVRDQLERPVNDFSVFFNSFDGGPPDAIIDDLFEDRHKNNVTPNTIAFYLRAACWDEGAQDWTPSIDRVNGVTLEIDAVEPSSQRILFLPLRMHIPKEDLARWIEPHRTTIIDVRLMRLPHKVTFVLR